MVEHSVPIFLFLSVAAILISFNYGRMKLKLKQQQSLQKLIDSGQVLSPELVSAIGKQEATPYIELSRGILLISLAAAMLVFGLLGVQEAKFAWLGIFPFALGVAFLLINKLKPKS